MFIDLNPAIGNSPAQESRQGFAVTKGFGRASLLLEFPPQEESVRKIKQTSLFSPAL